MKNNANDKLDNLFKAARSVRPDTSAVEDRFEVRLMARIRERKESISILVSWLWRLVPVFTALVIVVMVGSVAIEPEHSHEMFAAITNGHDEYLVKTYLTGE